MIGAVRGSKPAPRWGRRPGGRSAARPAPRSAIPNLDGLRRMAMRGTCAVEGSRTFVLDAGHRRFRHHQRPGDRGGQCAGGHPITVPVTIDSPVAGPPLRLLIGHHDVHYPVMSLDMTAASTGMNNESTAVATTGRSRRNRSGQAGQASVSTRDSRIPRPGQAQRRPMVLAVAGAARHAQGLSMRPCRGGRLRRQSHRLRSAPLVRLLVLGGKGVAVQVRGSPSKGCGLLHVATGHGSFCGRRRRASGG